MSSLEYPKRGEKVIGRCELCDRTPRQGEIYGPVETFYGVFRNYSLRRAIDAAMDAEEDKL